MSIRSPRFPSYLSRANLRRRRRVEETERPCQPWLRIALRDILAAMLGGGFDASNGADGIEGLSKCAEYVYRQQEQRERGYVQ
jgi:hypothetical protein